MLIRPMLTFSPLVLCRTLQTFMFFSQDTLRPGLRILAETGQTDSIMDEFSYPINTEPGLGRHA